MTSTSATRLGRASNIPYPAGWITELTRGTRGRSPLSEEVIPFFFHPLQRHYCIFPGRKTFYMTSSPAPLTLPCPFLPSPRPILCRVARSRGHLCAGI